MIWMVGVAVLFLYATVSYWHLHRRVSEAVILQNNIYQCETVRSPFVLGIIKPKIYLPYNIDGQDLTHVIAHEQAHIRRRDHWWKPLGFLFLTIHWFNPLMWLAYALLCRDIELACDEKVIKTLDNEERADYTQALVTCSINRRMVAACPLAFGEVGVKARVKSVMNYRKPSFWIITLAVIACMIVAVCFLTNPTSYAEEIMINGEIYIRQSWEINTLPDGSHEIGTLRSVTHHTSKHPQEDFSGVNLDEKYPGNMLFQSGNDPDTVYLEDLSGYYIPFSKNPFSSQEIAKLVGGNLCDAISIQPVSLIVLQNTGDSGLVNIADQEQIIHFLDLLKTTNFKKTSQRFRVVPDTLAADITLENETGAFIRMLMLSSPYRNEYSIYVQDSNGYYLEAVDPESLSNYIIWLVKNDLNFRDETSKVYVYENNGFGGNFELTLNRDGSFSYYEGLLSSYIGMGSWKWDGNILTLTDNVKDNKVVFVNYFEYNGEDLVFIERGSSNYRFVTVKNGERFHLAPVSDQNHHTDIRNEDLDDFAGDDAQPLSHSAFVFDGVVYDLAEGSPSVNAVSGYRS